MSESAKKLGKIKAALLSKNGRNVLLYLLFVVVAFAFWLMLSLDTETQQDFEIPVEIAAVPDSVTFISEPPSMLSVTIKGKGSQMLRYKWGGLPKIKLDFRSFDNGKGRFFVAKSKLEAQIRDIFGSSVLISSVRPDTIGVRYVMDKGRKVAVKINSNISTDIHYTLSGDITCYPESVTVYSINPLPPNLSFVETYLVSRADLTDSLDISVKLKPREGMRFIPDYVKVAIPVEPLISKTQTVIVDVKNLPHGENILTFPSKVNISYLLPMSQYKDNFPIKAYVEFDDFAENRDSSEVHKLPVKINMLPDSYRSIEITPDSVEYILERN